MRWRTLVMRRATSNDKTPTEEVVVVGGDVDRVGR